MEDTSTPLSTGESPVEPEEKIIDSSFTAQNDKREKDAESPTSPEASEPVEDDKEKIVRRILLASSGVFSTENTDTIFPRPLREMRVAYIPTAGNSPDVKNKSYMERRRAKFVELNFNYEEINLEEFKEAGLREKLQNFEAVIVEGGNTFYLLKVARESGFDIVIKELIDKGVVYLGSSAGSYIACPTIEVSGWSDKHNWDRYGLTDLTALGLVDFLIKAHYTPEQDEMLREKIKTASRPVHLLTDEQAILVEDGVFKFLGGPEITIDFIINKPPIEPEITNGEENKKINETDSSLTAQNDKGEESPAPEASTPTSPAPIPSAPPQEWSIADLAIQFKDKLKSLLAGANKKRREKAEKNLEKIMTFAFETQKVTNDDVEKLTGVSDARAKQYLQSLKKQGRLVQFGKTKNTFYKPIK